jgi:hypothetical protein
MRHRLTLSQALHIPILEAEHFCPYISAKFRGNHKLNKVKEAQEQVSFLDVLLGVRLYHQLPGELLDHNPSGHLLQRHLLLGSRLHLVL